MTNEERAAENRRWVRQKIFEKYGEEGVKRIDMHAQLIFLKRYAPAEIILKRFTLLMTFNGFLPQDFDTPE